MSRIKCAKCNKPATKKLENSDGEFIPLCDNYDCRMVVDLETMGLLMHKKERPENDSRFLKISDLQRQADERYPLWDFFVSEHGLILTESQLDDIINEVEKHIGVSR